MRDRQPTVPISPAGQVSSLRVLEPAGQSTPLSSPTRCPTAVITPNPHFSQPQSLEWDNLGENLIGYSVRELLAGVEKLDEDIRRKVSARNSNLLEEGRIAVVSTESSSLEDINSEVFGAAGNIWAEEMADTGFNSDINKLLEIEQDAVDAMSDLTVADVEAATIPYVKEALDRIKEKANEFRKGVRAMKQRHKELLTSIDLGSLDGRVEKLVADVKEHFKVIIRKVHDIDPVKSMTEFEKESLAQQKKNIEL